MSARQRVAAIGVALSVALGACNDMPSRASLVTRIADEEAVPAFDRFVAAAGELTAAADALCATPGADRLAGLRSALRQTWLAWRALEGFTRGPITDARSWARVDYPIAPDEIEAMLKDTTRGPIDASFVARSVAASTRGLGAIEHLVHSPSPPPLEALADQRRCAYLAAASQVVQDEAVALAAAWRSGDSTHPPYRDQFAAKTDMMTADESVDELVNNALSKLETVGRVELGGALGPSADAANPAAVVEGAAGLGVEDLCARVRSIRGALLGGTGTAGFAPLLGKGLAVRLGGEFDQVFAACGAIDGPLRAAVTERRDAVEALRRAVDAVRVTVSTEVVSRLGVTVGFSDNDGDSAG